MLLAARTSQRDKRAICAAIKVRRIKPSIRGLNPTRASNFRLWESVTYGHRFSRVLRVPRLGSLSGYDGIAAPCTSKIRF